MKRRVIAGCLAAAGLCMGGIHSASAATVTGSCVGKTTTYLNTLEPGAGGQNNAGTAQFVHAIGLNFGQDIASTPPCRP